MKKATRYPTQPAWRINPFAGRCQYQKTGVGLAKQQLERLARGLQKDYPSADAFLREGLDETPTLQRLGIKGVLCRTLRSANPIQNLNGSVAHFTLNARRWRDSTMVTALARCRLAQNPATLSTSATLPRHASTRCHSQKTRATRQGCTEEGRHEDKSSIEINSGAVLVQGRAGHPGPGLRASNIKCNPK